MEFHFFKNSEIPYVCMHRKPKFFCVWTASKGNEQVYLLSRRGNVRLWRTPTRRLRHDEKARRGGMSDDEEVPPDLVPALGETKCDIWSGRHPTHVCRNIRCDIAHFVKFERCDFFCVKKHFFVKHTTNDNQLCWPCWAAPRALRRTETMKIPLQRQY